VKVGDKVWLDSKHTPVDIPYKLTTHWFGPFEVLEARGAQVMLDPPETFGNEHNKINIRSLQFFEERDARLVVPDLPPAPLVTKDGTTRYEIKRIFNTRTHKGEEELCVEWKGYNQSQNCWAHRNVLMADVPHLVRTFDTNPSIFKARASAPKRATKGYKTTVAALPQPRRAGVSTGAGTWTSHQPIIGEEIGIKEKDTVVDAPTKSSWVEAPETA